MKKSSSEYIIVKDSKIHHKGVFAKKDVPKKTRVIEYIGKKITKKQADEIYDKTFEKHKMNGDNGAVYTFELNKKYDIDGNVSWNTAKWINHSCNPNCEVEIIKGHIWIIATKEIKKDEEITYNYGYDLECFEEHPCRCGSENCVGYIVAEEDWEKLKEKLAKS